jgi:hypothetical protein
MIYVTFRKVGNGQYRKLAETLKPDEKISLLEAMGIPVDEFYRTIYTTSEKYPEFDEVSRISLREFIER